MTEPIQGKLIYQATKKGKDRRVVFPTKKGESQPTQFKLDQISPELLKMVEEVVPVELELENGLPTRIRPVGKPWPQSQATSSQFPNPSGSKQSSAHSKSTPKLANGPSSSQQRNLTAKRGFHNPYNFVPSPPRISTHSELGDKQPVSHELWHPAYFSGSLHVKMTIKTPLLMLDASLAQEVKADLAQKVNIDHFTYPIRRSPDGTSVYIPPTSVKGMLRSAFEAITNSRMGVFSKEYNDRLAYRMNAKSGLQMVPARIEKNGNSWEIKLLTGSSQMESDGSPLIRQHKTHNQLEKRDPMFAAWVRRYHWHGKSAPTLPRLAATEKEHGKKVWAYLTLWSHGPFDFWNVVELRDFSASTPTDTPVENRMTKDTRKDGSLQFWNKAKRAGKTLGWVEGYLCHTNHNIKNKHDERVFFSVPGSLPSPIRLNQEQWEILSENWKTLIRNYRQIHEEVDGRLEKLPKDVPEWSRHIKQAHLVETLKENDLCYACVKKTSSTWEVIDLFPVMISRKLFDISPFSLLDPSLQPTNDLSQLSPAERVFGWVNQKGKGAYRGNLRIGFVECTSENPIEPLGNPGVPLAILGQPKPQQSRFYVAQSPTGEAQADGILQQEAAYSSGKGLRGRKVYPHHQNLPEAYWNNPQADRTQVNTNGHFQEYRRPKKSQPGGQLEEQQDSQNRSIQEWIKPGSVFEFDIYVKNLSSVELGALVWLLSRGKDHFHRLGGGKPFGFGSVELELDLSKSDFRTGANWADWYQSLGAPTIQPVPSKDVDDLIEQYKSALSPDEPFEQHPVIAAFLQSMKGFADGLPTHYPRSTPNPTPDGEAFQWFVANEQVNKNRKFALPDLASDPGLPVQSKD